MSNWYLVEANLRKITAYVKADSPEEAIKEYENAENNRAEKLVMLIDDLHAPTRPKLIEEKLHIEAFEKTLEDQKKKNEAIKNAVPPTPPSVDDRIAALEQHLETLKAEKAKLASETTASDDNQPASTLELVK